MEPALRKTYVSTQEGDSGRRMSGLHYPQMSKQNEQKEREKNTYSQTSRLETLEELQLHNNHEKFLF
jgi:hypothetical protein